MSSQPILTCSKNTGAAGCLFSAATGSVVSAFSGLSVIYAPAYTGHGRKDFLRLRKQLYDVEDVLTESREKHDYREMVERTSFLEHHRKGELSLVLNTDLFLEGYHEGANCLRSHTAPVGPVAIFFSDLDAANLSKGTQF